MTKKDYQLIAQALADALNERTNSISRGAILLAVEKIAQALQADNPCFDNERFIKVVTKQQKG